MAVYLEMKAKMKEILKDLGLVSFLSKFEDEKITADIVCLLTNDDMLDIGVNSPIDMMRLRKACTKYTYGSDHQKMDDSDNDDIPDLVGSSDEDCDRVVSSDEDDYRRRNGTTILVPVVGPNQISEADYWLQQSADFLNKQDIYVRIFSLSPFLFGMKFVPNEWIDILKKGGLLAENRLSRTDGISDDEWDNIDIIEAATTAVLNDVKSKDVLSYILYHIGPKVTIDMYSEKDMLNELKWQNLLRKKLLKEQQDRVKIGVDYVYRQYYDQMHSFIRNREDFVDKILKDFNKKHGDTAKDKGNVEYKKGNFKAAVKHYTKAVKLDPFNAVYYGNRCQAYFKLKDYREALGDSRRAVTLDPNWHKAHIRYAKAFYELGNLFKAIQVNQMRLETLRGLRMDKVNADDLMELEEQSRIFQLEIFDENQNTHVQIITGADNTETKIVTQIRQKGEIPILPSGLDANSLAKRKRSRKDNAVDPLPLKPQRVQTQHLLHCNEMEKRNGEVKRPAPKYKELVKEGSIALQVKSFQRAVLSYQKALDINVITSEKSIELILLKYALATALLAIGIDKYVLASIEKFKDILDKHSSIKFPLAYMGLGRAYITVNRFKESLTPLYRGKCMVEKRSVTVYQWPGTDTNIEETSPGRMETLFNGMIHISLHPPKPDAVCRIHNKENDDRDVIYVGDPYYKGQMQDLENGFIRLQCTESCAVELHTACWKLYKANVGQKSANKDYIDQSCLTPDCKGFIIKINIFRQEESLNKEIVSEKEWKVTKPKGNRRKMEASSGRKIAKKLEKKEQRRMHKNKPQQEAVEKNELVEDLDMLIDNDNQDCAEDDSDDESAVKLTQSTDVTVLKKDDDEFKDPLYKGKQKQTHRKKKKEKEKNILALEVTFNDKKRETLQGEHFLIGGVDETEANHARYSVNPDTPFSVPDDLREQIQLFESTYTGPEPGALETNEVTKNMFSFFADLLHTNGPLNLMDPILINELEVLPLEAADVIRDAGGLGPFLLQSLRFAMIDEYLCLLPDAGKARELAKAKRENIDSRECNSRTSSMTDSSEMSYSGASCYNHNHSEMFSMDPKPLTTSSHDFPEMCHLTTEDNKVLSMHTNDDNIAYYNGTDYIPEISLSFKGDNKEHTNRLDDIDDVKFSEYSTPDLINNYNTKTHSIDSNSISSDLVDTDLPSFYSQSGTDQNSVFPSAFNSSDAFYPTLSSTEKDFETTVTTTKATNLTPVEASLQFSNAQIPSRLSIVGKIPLAPLPLPLPIPRKHSSSSQDSSISVSRIRNASVSSSSHNDSTRCSPLPSLNESIIKKNLSAKKPWENTAPLKPLFQPISSSSLAKPSKKTAQDNSCNSLTLSDAVSTDYDEFVKKVDKEFITDMTDSLMKEFLNGKTVSNEERQEIYDSMSNQIQEDLKKRKPVFGTLESTPSQEESLPVSNEPSTINQTQNINLKCDVYEKVFNCSHTNDREPVLTLTASTILRKHVSVQCGIESQSAATMTNPCECVDVAELADLRSNARQLAPLEEEYKKYKTYMDAQMTHYESLKTTYDDRIRRLESSEKLSAKRSTKDGKEIVLLKENISTLLAIEQRAKEKLSEKDEAIKCLYDQMATERKKLMSELGQLRVNVDELRPELEREHQRSVSAEVQILQFRLKSTEQVLQHGKSVCAMQLQQTMANIGKHGKERPPSPLLSLFEYWKNSAEKINEQLAKLQTDYNEQIQLVRSGTPLSDLPSLVTSPPDLSRNNSMPMPGFHTSQPFPMSGSGDLQPLTGNVGSSSSSDLTSTPSSVRVPAFFNHPKPLTMPFTAPEGSRSLFQQRPLVPPAGIQARAPLVVPRSIRPQGAINVIGNVISENKAPGSPSGSRSENPRSFAPPPGLTPKQTPIQAPQQSSSSFEKLVSVLRKVYVSYSRNDIIKFIQDLRKMRGGSLSGMSLNQIVDQVSEIIEEKEKEPHALNPQSMYHLSSMTERAVAPPPGIGAGWGFAGSNTALSTEVFAEEVDPCIICHEELSIQRTAQLECSHRFHDECIRKWLKEQSTCPTCRVHALMPDDFPSLR